jgi:cytochrome c peroxidase
VHTAVHILSVIIISTGCKGVFEDLRSGKNNKGPTYLGQNGSGNTVGLIESLNPNSIPLLKDLENEQYNIFTPDAKIAMSTRQDDSRVNLMFRTVSPSPETSVSGEGLLKIENLELPGNRHRVFIETENDVRIRFGPFQSHLAMDSRFSEGLPFRVRNISNCHNAKPFEALDDSDFRGRYECYKLIHYATFNEPNQGYVKAHITVITEAFGNNGQRSRSPKVVSAEKTDMYRILRLKNGEQVPSSIELSGTADGRILIAAGAEVSIHDKPWLANGWTFTGLGAIHTFKNKKFCRRKSCSNEQLETFGDVYPITKYPIRNYKGDFLTHPDLLKCGYLWMHPEGTDVFCRMNAGRQFRDLSDAMKSLKTQKDKDNFYIHTAMPSSAQESSTGMKYHAMGMSTNWTIRTIDGGINLFRHDPDKTASRNQLHRPHSIVFLGMNKGFWSDSTSSDKNSNLPMSLRGMRFQFLTQSHAHIREDTTAFDPLRRKEDRESKLQYWEFDVGDCLDKEVIVSLRFQSPYYHDVTTNKKTKNILDTACHFPAKTAASEAGVNPAVSEIPNTQKIYHTGEIGMVGQMLGFVGEGLWVKKKGKLNHNIPNVHPHLNIKEKGFSAEFAVRFLSKPTKKNGSMHLLTIPKIVQFDLVKTSRDFKIKATDLTSGKKTSIFSKGFNPDTKAPYTSDKTIVLGKWNHIGVRYTPGKNAQQMTMELLVSGRKHASVKLPKSALKGAKTAVNLNGNCNSCKGDDLFIIDEIQLSSVSRGVDYFASGAFETNESTKKKFLNAQQSKSLLNGIGIKKLSFNGKSLLDEFFLPAELAVYSKSKNAAKAKAAVRLGKKLFESPLLSVNSKLMPQIDIRNGKPISCASCHIASKAFTDGEKLASGVKLGNLNTPTILNRALGRKHFFDHRSDSLIDQVLRPITNPAEMNSTIKNVVKAISKSKNLRKQFKKAGLKIDANGIAKALTMFTIEQTQFLDSSANVWTEAAKLGQKLFFGKARCASCHNGVSLTNENSHDTGAGNLSIRIKTPSLVKINETGSYFHNGSHSSLLDVVNFYNEGFLKNRTKNRSLDLDMRPLGLNKEEKDALVEFLKAIPHKGL